MHKLLVLFGAFLCLSLTAAAQESTAALDATGSASEPAAQPTLGPSNRQPWQLGAGFQYQHYTLYGQKFNNYGFNSDFTGYLKDWFGIEGTAAMGFGHTGTTAKVPVSLHAKSVFVGGGPHIAINNKTRFEPWVHVLVGLEHFRFTQTNNTLGLGSNSAFGFLAGGGVDYKLAGDVSWRIQGDFIGSHFGSSVQKNYSFGTGLILNF